MTPEIRRTLSFAKSTFSEADGKASFTRIATAFLIVAALIWVTRLVWIDHALPDFGGLTLFITALYGLNKAGAATTAIMETKSTDCPPEQLK